MGSKDISLVLGSGAARGLTEIGVIQELEARGYNIVSIVGTSIGSLVGGIYAAGALDKFVDYISAMERSDFLKVIDPVLGDGGYIKGNKIFDLIAREIVEDKLIEDLDIPFKAISVDIESNREFIFNSGSLFKAIRSSISIPGVFTPVEHEGMRLVDGAVLSPLPIEHLDYIEGSKVITVSLNGLPQECNMSLNSAIAPIETAQGIKAFPAKIRTAVSSKIDKLHHNNIDIYTDSFELMNHKMAKLTLQLHRTDLLIEVPYSLCELHQFYFAKELIEAGRELAIKVLDENGY